MCPQAIPLAMMTMRKSIHRFPFLSYMSMGLCLRATGAPLLNVDKNDTDDVLGILFVAFKQTKPSSLNSWFSSLASKLLTSEIIICFDFTF